MPVWHEATRRWVREGRLVLLGVTQEQHADRCRLFAQWKRFDWPILYDPINVLQLRGVPMFVAIDEHGIVRQVRPNLEDFEREFLDRAFEDDAPKAAPPLTPPRDEVSLRRRAEASNTARAWRDVGDALTLWGGPERLDEAIQAYTQATRLNPEDGNAWFRLGVVYRMRFDSDHPQPGDFQRAVECWERALSLDPNQYIWRRRLQQYGPRLDKPYPFYDWVQAAIADIRARGETPVALRVPPYGAEIAHPSRTFAVETESETSPDPEGRIQRDREGLIRIEVAVVPPEVRPGGTARVHLTFFPSRKHKTYWNNEAGPLRVWLEPPPGWRVSRRSLTAPLGQEPETDETRYLDFEVQAPPDAQGTVRLPAYALYFVCEDVGGTCRFLRQDITIEIPVGDGKP